MATSPELAGKGKQGLREELTPFEKGATPLQGSKRRHLNEEKSEGRERRNAKVNVYTNLKRGKRTDTRQPI